MCKDDIDCGDKNDIECDNKDKKIDKFAKTFHDNGIGCGNKIADIAKEIHHDALAIVPLYRSCIVVEQSDEERKEGVCTLHAYADPHWLGGEIDIDTLKSDDFHFKFSIRGDRQGPSIVNVSHPEEDDHRDECIIENDEN